MLCVSQRHLRHHQNNLADYRNKVIAFWQEYDSTIHIQNHHPRPFILTTLTNRYLEREYLKNYKATNIVLLRPSVVDLLKRQKGQLDEVKVTIFRSKSML